LTIFDIQKIIEIKSGSTKLIRPFLIWSSGWRDTTNYSICK